MMCELSEMVQISAKGEAKGEDALSPGPLIFEQHIYSCHDQIAREQIRTLTKA
jgi:hypothetical protein